MAGTGNKQKTEAPTVSSRRQTTVILCSTITNVMERWLSAWQWIGNGREIVRKKRERARPGYARVIWLRSWGIPRLHSLTLLCVCHCSIECPELWRHDVRSRRRLRGLKMVVLSWRRSDQSLVWADTAALSCTHKCDTTTIRYEHTAISLQHDTTLYEESKQELSYRKQIARQLRKQIRWGHL